MGLLIEMMPASLRRRADRGHHGLGAALQEAESALRSARRHLEQGELRGKEAADAASEAVWLLLLRLRHHRD